jgi:hypothetical protein
MKRHMVNVKIYIDADDSYSHGDVVDDVMDSLAEVMPGVTGSFEDPDGMEYSHASYQDGGKWNDEKEAYL